MVREKSSILVRNREIFCRGGSGSESASNTGMAIEVALQFCLIVVCCGKSQCHWEKLMLLHDGCHSWKFSSSGRPRWLV